MTLLDFVDTSKEDKTSLSKQKGLMIIDLSQIIISATSMTFKKGESYTPELIHKLGLNTIKNITKKFKDVYPTIVIAVDSQNYWRKDIAPYYKGNRKLARDKSSLDFPIIYKGIDILKDALINYFPYIVMELPRCEADDIAGVLSKNFSSKYENILLVSSDSDWSQLQKFKNVKQWSSQAGGYVHPKHGGPHAVLLYKIIKGDKKDAIANIRSPQDAVITKTRQKSIGEVEAERWIMKKPEEYCNELMLERFKHNEKLLDLCNIPQEYEDLIMSEFIGKKDIHPSRSKIYPYLIKSGLSSLSGDINDF